MPPPASTAVGIEYLSGKPVFRKRRHIDAYAPVVLLPPCRRAIIAPGRRAGAPVGLGEHDRGEGAELELFQLVPFALHRGRVAGRVVPFPARVSWAMFGVKNMCITKHGRRANVMTHLDQSEVDPRSELHDNTAPPSYGANLACSTSHGNDRVQPRPLFSPSESASPGRNVCPYVERGAQTSGSQRCLRERERLQHPPPYLSHMLRA